MQTRLYKHTHIIERRKFRRKASPSSRCSLLFSFDNLRVLTIHSPSAPRSIDLAIVRLDRRKSDVEWMRNSSRWNDSSLEIRLQSGNSIERRCRYWLRDTRQTTESCWEKTSIIRRISTSKLTHVAKIGSLSAIYRGSYENQRFTGLFVDKRQLNDRRVTVRSVWPVFSYNQSDWPLIHHYCIERVRETFFRRKHVFW